LRNCFEETILQHVGRDVGGHERLEQLCEARGGDGPGEGGGAAREGGQGGNAAAHGHAGARLLDGGGGDESESDGIGLHVLALRKSRNSRTHPNNAVRTDNQGNASFKLGKTRRRSGNQTRLELDEAAFVACKLKQDKTKNKMSFLLAACRNAGSACVKRESRRGAQLGFRTQSRHP
jgi:hypothetical protein